MCTADTLHAYLRNLEGAGSPHSYVCNKTAQVIQDLKKKKKGLGPFLLSLSLSPGSWQQTCLLCTSRRAGPKGQSQPGARRDC